MKIKFFLNTRKKSTKTGNTPVYVLITINGDRSSAKLPIESTGLRFFIDLSNTEYQVIETNYVLGKGNSEKYISSTLFNSAVDLLLLIDNKKKYTEYFEKHLMKQYFPFWDAPYDLDLLWTPA